MKTWDDYDNSNNKNDINNNLSGSTEWIGWVGEDTAMSSWAPTSPDTALSLFMYLDHQNDIPGSSK